MTECAIVWENLLRGRMLSHAFAVDGAPTALCGLDACRSWLVWQNHQASDVKCRKCAAKAAKMGAP